MYLKRNSEQEFLINLGDITFNFGKLGINKITHPLGFTHSESHTIVTDWPSPYQAGTVSNGTPDNNHAAVSGNHGTEGAGQWATANSESTSIKIGGVEVLEDGSERTFKKAEMTTVNHVTNKANINLSTGVRSQVDFIETVKYTFEHNHMQIEVELEALNDFYINWYMGLQLTRGGWNYDAYFNHDLAQTDLYIQNEELLNSGIKAESPDMQRVTMRNQHGDAIHIFMDKEYGVGYSKIRDDDPIAYLRENNQKFYFHLVKNGNTLIVPKGEKVSYRGSYIFGKNKAVNATNLTYFTENGINKAYVDFKVIATENIEFTNVEDSFNCVFGTNSITSTAPNAYAKLVI
ncbi:hypothetical protein CHI07_17145 [Paenibacillus sp. 7884-2]|nr:hypothetical protein CHI07_17145 [Paenibacillus sp. 7884-2]